jgi:hypothetical protein
MHKKITFLVTIFVVLGLTSCGESIAYKYDNRDHVVTCEGINQNLMNEALYSFEDNIAKAAPNNNYGIGSPLYYAFGYASYIYRGVMGESDYQKIASQHSQALAKELAKEPIWTGTKPNVKLDYNSPFVKCLVENVEHEELKRIFNNLKSANSMDIKLMINIFMKQVKQTATDRDLATIVALDTYYRHLINETVYQPPLDE